MKEGRERVRIELILFHGLALLSFTAVQLLTRLAATPFVSPFAASHYLFINRRIRGRPDPRA